MVLIWGWNDITFSSVLSPIPRICLCFYQPQFILGASTVPPCLSKRTPRYDCTLFTCSYYSTKVKSWALKSDFLVKHICCGLNESWLTQSNTDHHHLYPDAGSVVVQMSLECPHSSVCGSHLHGEVGPFLLSYIKYPEAIILIMGQWLRKCYY